jgi:phosphatidylserine decarboxylase
MEMEAPSSRPNRIPLAREGYPLIAGTAAATVLLFLFGLKIPAAVALVLTGLVVNFFRDPERATPTDPGLIVSPADGRVIKVAALRDERFLNGDVTLISIFMSPLNVHVNRIPASGRVVDLRYHPGKYFRAFADKASLDNEQNAVVLEDDAGRRLCFVQIAGFVARRIVCRLQVGMQVDRGQRYGMIMFGSRADIYLPPGARVCVTVGDRAYGGETVLAQWR